MTTVRVRSPNGPSGEETCLQGGASFDGAWGAPPTTPGPRRAGGGSGKRSDSRRSRLRGRPSDRGQGLGIEAEVSLRPSWPRGSPPTVAVPRLEPGPRGAVRGGSGHSRDKARAVSPRRDTDCAGLPLSEDRMRGRVGYVTRHARCEPSSFRRFHFHQGVCALRGELAACPSSPSEAQPRPPPARLTQPVRTRHCLGPVRGCAARLLQRLPLRGAPRHSRRFYG